MAISGIKERIHQPNFHRDYYHYVLVLLMVVIILMMAAVGAVLYEMYKRPLPVFYVTNPKAQKMQLTPFDEPNLLPDTILRWASKAAVGAYTFDFYNYRTQINSVRPYFTDDGWQDYLRSVEPLINRIVENQLFVNGVVSGIPVISNQGPLPGKGYTWRVQIPFLVTYQSANITTKRNFLVIITVVRVSTNINPQGIGIDQFVMV